MKKKKEWETKVISTVISLIDDFPEGDIQSFEGPDFLVNTFDKIIGIEIVEYIRGQTINGSLNRHEEVIQHQIAQKAQEKFESISDTPLIVRLFPSSNKKLSKLSAYQRDEIVDCIIEKVGENIPGEVNVPYKVQMDWYADKKLAQFIPSIWVTLAKRDSHWGFINADFISATKEEIQRIIDSKNLKIEGYHEYCHQAWLIIVARGYPISSCIDVSYVINETYSSKFSRTYIFLQDENRIYNLKNT